MSSFNARHETRLRQSWSEDDLDVYERWHMAHCRERLFPYRKFLTPSLIEGWFQQEVAEHLEQFWLDMQEGLAPVLVLTAPPQHGKSRQVIDFTSWAIGKDPDLKVIYASYSDSLGLVANTTLQRIMDSPRYKKVFPFTGLNAANVVTMAGRTMRNSRHLEFTGGGTGSFRNTTVNGQVTGMGLRLGIIDDPVKGRKEARSPTVSESTWSWFTDDFFTRFSETAGLLMIMTRWTLDDPVGRFMEHYPNVKVLNYPALGRVKGGEWIEDDENGEPLFPELKSREFLQKRKGLLTVGSWKSLYMGSPIVVGGDMFPVQKFGIVKAVPIDAIKRSVRYWDKAGTEGGTGARTAGVLMHQLHNGRFLVEDLIDGRWSALDREDRIYQTAQLDNRDRRVETWVEQEPGSGGKESAESTVRRLAGYKCFADRVSGQGSKEIRAEPYAAQVQAGNVDLLEAPWNKPFLNEHEQFPMGKYKDRVDSAGGSFIKLTVRKSRYDSSLGWVSGTKQEEAMA